MWRIINDSILLSELVENDREALVSHLKEKEVSDWTLRIPFPYSLADADRFIQLVTESTKKSGRATNWAIREKESTKLIGCIGFHEFVPEAPHRAEIGYWLAKSHWGKGIMTAVLKAVCEVGFNEFELARISANLFEGNERSERVVLKCGFQGEGILRCYYCKGEEIFDGRLYTRLADWANEARREGEAALRGSPIATLISSATRSRSLPQRVYSSR